MGWLRRRHLVRGTTAIALAVALLAACNDSRDDAAGASIDVATSDVPGLDEETGGASHDDAESWDDVNSDTASDEFHDATPGSDAIADAQEDVTQDVPDAQPDDADTTDPDTINPDTTDAASDLGPSIGEPCNCHHPDAVCSNLFPGCVLPDAVDCSAEDACPEDFRCARAINGASYCRCDGDSCWGPVCPGEGAGDLPCPSIAPECWVDGVCIGTPDCLSSVQCRDGFACARTTYRNQELTDDEIRATAPVEDTCVPESELPYDRDYLDTASCRNSEDCADTEVCEVVEELRQTDLGICIPAVGDDAWKLACDRRSHTFSFGSRRCYGEAYSLYEGPNGFGWNCRRDDQCQPGASCTLLGCGWAP